MPRGGKRLGAGRPRGSANRKTREIANEAVVRGVKLPLEYMLAVVGDEAAPQARRDQMAIAAAPFCHPRLSAITTSNTSVNYKGGDDVGIINIFAVPHGGRVEPDGTITIDGVVTELKPVEPFTPTPPLSLTDQTEQPARFEPIAEPLPVHEAEQPANVTRLDRYRDRDDEPSGAA
jgi:hypothetical protein